MQAIQVDQLSVAEFWRRWTVCNDLCHFLLHLLELGHLNENFVHLFVGESFKQLLAVRLVQLFLGHSFHVECLKIFYAILLDVDVLRQCTLKVNRALFPGIF